MSSSVVGTFTRNSANRVTATFVIDQIMRSFTATISPAIQPFTSNQAKLTYDDLEKLTGTRNYSGRVGINDFSLTLDNGVTIVGELNPPGIQPASTVDGTGNWEES
ncbi:hypothetical protein B0J11DRAFT_602027 [Dendryphion nanum]|uniref:Uncharacterized protein n=1 Tax=Dendryphion nanum TaxID=256645 RepID=A0A9P9I6H4_9PLEO|nr:hypothetical protein B0J11DRAFT_602027 [Dendryphion nanum]